LSFELEPNEVLGLWKFINFFREPFTDKQIETDHLHKATDAGDTEELINFNKRWRDKQS